MSRVEEALQESKTIRECTDSLAVTQEKAMLESYGFQADSSTDSEVSSEEETEMKTSSSPPISIHLPLEENATDVERFPVQLV